MVEIVKRSTKHILLGASLITGAVVAAGAVAYGVTHKMMSVALSRNGMKIADYRRNAKRILKGSDQIDAFLQAIDDADDYIRTCETVLWHMEGYDGVDLVAHWYPCENAKRIVVAMHGWRSSWAKDFGMMASFWHNEGCHVLFVEQRGQGQSGGDYMGFGMTERFDCRDWVRRVDEQNDARLPIYLVGVSMGATTVLMASSLELPETVRGIIADCGFTSPHAIWKHVANNKMRIPYEPVGRLVDDICRKKTTFGSKEITAGDALAVTSIPVLFIHGTDDHFVPVTMTYENYKVCASEKRLLVVPGADHAMSYYMDTPRYQQAVADFFKTYDD